MKSGEELENRFFKSNNIKIIYRVSLHMAKWFILCFLGRGSKREREDILYVGHAFASSCTKYQPPS